MMPDDEYASALAGAESFLSGLIEVADEYGGGPEFRIEQFYAAREAVRRERQRLEVDDA